MLILALLACADPGLSQAGLLLLDGEALDAGWLVEAEGEILGTALPVPEGLFPHLIDPDGGQVEVDFFAGELTVVEGEAGEVGWLVLGEDVARDAIEVQGDEASAELLLAQVEGALELLDSGLWLLQGPEIVEELGWIAEEPGGLYALRPLDDPAFVEARYQADGAPDSGSFSDRIDELRLRVEHLQGGSVGQPRRPAAAGLEAMLSAERAALAAQLTPWIWVGAWEVDGRCVVLDGVGGVDDCRGRDLGTWTLESPTPTLSFQLDSDQRTWEMR